MRVDKAISLLKDGYVIRKPDITNHKKKYQVMLVLDVHGIPTIKYFLSKQVFFWVLRSARLQRTLDSMGRETYSWKW